MALSSKTLSVLQRAGSLVLTVDTDLKKAVTRYAGQVNAAMDSNPLHSDTASMIENWKALAGLSKAVAILEEDIKKIYFSAAKLVTDESQDAAATPQPVAKDVTVLAPAAPKKNAKTKSKKSKVKKAAPGELRGNALKLMQHLALSLNQNEMISINQSKIAKEAGIPMGSVTAAIKKLVEQKLIETNPTGQFKLPMTKPV